MSSATQSAAPPNEENTEDNHTGSSADKNDGGQSELEVSLAIRKVVHSGRGICRLVTLCCTVRQLVKENDRRLLNSPDSDDEDEDEAPHPPQDPQELAQRRDRDWRSYQALVRFVPGLKRRISDPCELSRGLYYSHLIKGANSARSDDTSIVKQKIAEWLNQRMVGAPVHDHLSLSSRIGRGLQGDITGRLLCPIKYNWDDLSVRAKVRDQADGYNASADYWLRCLYEGEEGNSADVEKGFLKGELLVKTFKLIFTSPSSADSTINAPNNRSRSDGTTRTGHPKRPNNAQIHGMDGSVTPRAIAYAATQLHFNLTDATQWMIKYNGFHYEEFYEFIVDFFEADSAPEAMEASGKLLEWWNRAVFPTSSATRAAAPTSARRESLATLRLQRQAARSSQPPS